MKKLTFLIVLSVLGFIWLTKNDDRPAVLLAEPDKALKADTFKESIQSDIPTTLEGISSDQTLGKIEKVNGSITAKDELSYPGQSDGRTIIENFFVSDLAPKSVQSLLKSKTFKMPQKTDGSSEPNGIMTGHFKGYVQVSDQSFTRIKIESSFSRQRADYYATLSLEENQKWFTANSEKNLRQYNFSTDLYSLVYVLPGQRIIYLKFFLDVKIPEEERNKRVFSGWIYDPANKLTQKLALTDNFESSVDGNAWPTPNEIETLFPPNLLQF